jgi:hypothetical protein
VGWSVGSFIYIKDYLQMDPGFNIKGLKWRFNNFTGIIMYKYTWPLRNHFKVHIYIFIAIFICIWVEKRFRTCLERGLNRVSLNVNLFLFKIYFLNVFRLFWCADVKNNFFLKINYFDVFVARVTHRGENIPPKKCI